MKSKFLMVILFVLIFSLSFAYMIHFIPTKNTPEEMEQLKQIAMQIIQEEQLHIFQDIDYQVKIYKGKIIVFNGLFGKYIINNENGKLTLVEKKQNFANIMLIGILSLYFSTCIFLSIFFLIDKYKTHHNKTKRYTSKIKNKK